MRWISRWFRSPAPPRMAITVLPIGEGHTTSLIHPTLAQAMAILDQRNLPATWAIARQASDMRLAEPLVSGCSCHELAFVLERGDLASETASFEQISRIARRVQLPLRTLVTSTRGVHPSLLAQWGVEAVVSLRQDAALSPTGSLRALTWGIWEVPVTDRLVTPATDSETDKLECRLQDTVSQSTRMHLLWRLSPLVQPGAWWRVCRLLDEVAEFHGRGWLKMETAGSAAAATSRQATPGVAA